MGIELMLLHYPLLNIACFWAKIDTYLEKSASVCLKRKIQPPSVRSQYLRAKRKLLDIIAAN